MFNLVERNSALATARVVRSFENETEAATYGLQRFGSPQRKRTFASLEIQGPNGYRRELVRGMV